MTTTTQTPPAAPPTAAPVAPARPAVIPPRSLAARGLGQIRYRLLAMGALAFVLALITLLQAIHAYSTSYDLLRGIVDQNSTTVDASENALQDIAQTSQAAGRDPCTRS